MEANGFYACTGQQEINFEINSLGLSLTKNKHARKVKLQMIRYHAGMSMDYDSLFSTGKLPIAIIVLAKVIIDDKESIIAQRDYRKVRVKTKGEQKTIIVIKDI